METIKIFFFCGDRICEYVLTLAPVFSTSLEVGFCSPENSILVLLKKNTLTIQLGFEGSDKLVWCRHLLNIHVEIDRTDLLISLLNKI